MNKSIRRPLKKFYKQTGLFTNLIILILCSQIKILSTYNQLEDTSHSFKLTCLGRGSQKIRLFSLYRKIFYNYLKDKRNYQLDQTTQLENPTTSNKCQETLNRQFLHLGSSIDYQREEPPSSIEKQIHLLEDGIKTGITLKTILLQEVMK